MEIILQNLENSEELFDTGISKIPYNSIVQLIEYCLLELAKVSRYCNKQFLIKSIILKTNQRYYPYCASLQFQIEIVLANIWLIS